MCLICLYRNQLLLYLNKQNQNYNQMTEKADILVGSSTLPGLFIPTGLFCATLNFVYLIHYMQTLNNFHCGESVKKKNYLFSKYADYIKILKITPTTHLCEVG